MKKKGNRKAGSVGWVLALTIILMLIVSCSPNADPPADNEEQQQPIIKIFIPSFERDLKNAMEQWQAQDVTHYSLQVRHVNSVWHAQAYSIEYKNGEVTHSAVCIPAPTEGGKCEIKDYDPQDYTVEGLFEMARQIIESQEMEFIKLEFDGEYGHPVLIAFDDPDIVDEDYWIKVLEFEVIEAEN